MTQQTNNPVAITEIVTSDNLDWFVRSSYWGTTSRALQRMGGEFDTAIEVNMSPVNPDMTGVWESMKEVRIREHRTSERPERFTHHVSGAQARLLLDAVGEEFYHTIVHADLLAEIDKTKWEETNKWHWQGGGVPFILIARDPWKFPHLANHFIEMLKCDSYWLSVTPADVVKAIFLSLQRRVSTTV